jgi:hypothetical protein
MRALCSVLRGSVDPPHPMHPSTITGYPRPLFPALVPLPRLTHPTHPPHPQVWVPGARGAALASGAACYAGRPCTLTVALSGFVPELARVYLVPVDPGAGVVLTSPALVANRTVYPGVNSLTWTPGQRPADLGPAAAKVVVLAGYPGMSGDRTRVVSDMVSFEVQSPVEWRVGAATTCSATCGTGTLVSLRALACPPRRSQHPPCGAVTVLSLSVSTPHAALSLCCHSL